MLLKKLLRVKNVLIDNNSFQLWNLLSNRHQKTYHSREMDQQVRVEKI